MRYADSPLSMPDAHDLAGPLPGEVLADRPLPGGGHLLDHTGPGFALLCRPAHTAALADNADALSLALLPLQSDDGATLLLRPDGHVAARWPGLPPAGALARALARATCIHHEETTA